MKHEMKQEPINKVVNPCAVAEIGAHQVRVKAEPLYKGRGLEAPKSTMATHKTGSQGEH